MNLIKSGQFNENSCKFHHQPRVVHRRRQRDIAYARVITLYDAHHVDVSLRGTRTDKFQVI